MICVKLTAAQFAYVRAALRRDLEMLAEMAPWDIDDQQEEHAEDVRLNRAVARLLDRVEQEQVAPL